MNILILGANGQLGLSLRDALKTQKGAQLVGNMVNNYFFTDLNLPLGERSYVLDITNTDQVEAFICNNKISIVVNCAAYTNVDAAQDNFEMADLLNNKAPSAIAKLCANYNCLFIHISTDYIFNGLSSVPYLETDTPNPQSVYGSTKLAGEEGIKASLCQYIIFRTAWLYSKYGKNFVKTISSLIKTRFLNGLEEPVDNLEFSPIGLEPLNVVNDQKGTPTSAEDLAYAIIYAINKYILNNLPDNLKVKEVYNYTNEGTCTWFIFARAIEFCLRSSKNDSTFDVFCKKNESLSDKFLVKPCSSDKFISKVTRPSYSVLDKGKVKKDLGLEISHWYDSLKTVIYE